MGLLNDFSPGGEAIDLSSADFTRNAAFGVYVGTAGDVKVDTIENTGLVIQAPAGSVLPWACRKVYQIGTTASGLVTVKLP